MTISEPKKVLLVCMVDSIHVARWIEQFDAGEIEFILFPSTPNRKVHSKILKMKADQGNIKIVPFRGWLSIPLWGVDLIFSDYVRGLLLRTIISKYNPDFIHALELQHAGYITSRALENSRIKTTFIATNYGSDIYWFQQFPRHLAKIRRVLGRADRYSAECQRDVELAIKHGFTGEVMPVYPNAGGFTEQQLASGVTATSSRNVIAIKGYEGWVGRASVAVASLYLLREELAEFTIVFYSSNAKTIRLAKKLRKETGLKVQLHKKGSLTHAQMLTLLASAKVYLGISLSDGISTSLLEAMAMGAFPIQTTTACVSEWFEHGKSGLYISTVSTKAVVEAMSIALGNQINLDTAQEINRSKILEKASPAFGRKASAIYRETA